MIKIPLLNRIDYIKHLQQYDLQDYEICSWGIGNDDKIYLLVAEKIPDRDRGMFVKTESNTNYQALIFSVSWDNGNLQKVDKIDFGVLKPNFHFIQRLEEDFLLVGARTHYQENNGYIIDSQGNFRKECCFGDGIQQCMVDKQNRIITSYFDEGVFGNYGWEDPIGSCGLMVWSSEGKPIWRNTEHDICDCYAINIDDQDQLWFYYYTDFLLVKTDYHSEQVFDPKLSGSSAFLIHQDGKQFLFDAGYQKHGQFVTKAFSSRKVKKVTAQFTWKQQALRPMGYTFRSSKALLTDNGGFFYLAEWH